MKEKRTTKLYEGLSPKQKAALTLHYIGEQDAAEIERIRSTVEWKTYRCIDAEYTDWRDRFFDASLVWGVMYWRALFIHELDASAFHRAVHRLLDSKADGEERKAFDEADQAQERSLARVVALQEALKDVCQQHGLDHEDVTKLAGASMMERMGCEPDTACQAEVTQVLLEVLPE